MYNKKRIKHVMQQFNMTLTELQQYRHIKSGAVTAHQIAQRDGLETAHVGAIQYIVEATRSEARQAGFIVGLTAWESGNDEVFVRGMTLAAQLHDWHRVE